MDMGDRRARDSPAIAALAPASVFSSSRFRLRNCSNSRISCCLLIFLKLEAMGKKE